MTPTFAEVSKSHYIVLTTFTKDGRPKPTAVGAAADGDRLLVHTEEDTWKVKRIRNTSRVTVAVCDIRGRQKGEPVEAVAKVLDKAQTADVQRAVTKQYGLFGRLFDLYLKLSGVDKKSIGIELTAA
jgi:PPOX class probable F420-dependent enzyme